MQPNKRDLSRLKKSANDIMREVSDVIEPIVERLYEKLDKIARKKEKPSEKIPTCGTAKAVGNYKSSEVKRAAEVRDEVIDQIKQNPHVFNEIANIGNQSTDISTETNAGSDRGSVVLPEIGTPKWVKELKEMVRGFVSGQKARSKDYYDPEDLVRGVLSKQSEKKIKKEIYIYTLLDTSGSMNTILAGGKTYIELMMSIIPSLVQEYQGEVILCDSVIHKPIYKNRQIREALEKTGKFVYAGGGGTEFDLAYRYIISEIQEVKKKQPNAEALVLTLTDAGVRWNLNLIRELKNFIVVTSPKEARNVAVITENFPKQEFPNIRNIFIR
jgi:uncharacterized protein with von Willebrand factor type A (vWA) domain